MFDTSVYFKISHSLNDNDYMELSVIIKHGPRKNPCSTEVNGINTHSQLKEKFNSCFWFQWLLTNCRYVKGIFKIKQISMTSSLNWA